ncbi:alpha/beta hydrolase fold domain-containing protein [Speluncibacter jeojiensis]|uniref:Alpha/beta hydrolase n=1 Tax=Speluncibacter jeojiensis TaxID=2710754 RepID=A0A9X4REX5_9ACTN|nr:alpha/beta hydrolase [Corynebacteriales bacterium D3-21]
MTDGAVRICLPEALVRIGVRLRGSRRDLITAARARRHVARLQRSPAGHAPPRRLSKTATFVERSFRGRPCYEVSPRAGAVAGRALYLHGGGYVREIVRQHWQFVAELVAATGVAFTVPIYPLAPRGTAATLVPTAADLAEELLRDAGADRMFLMGDSAGGGLAAAVALELRERGAPRPARTILISPWLDATMSDPAIDAIAPRDPFLAVPGAHVFADYYRGALDPRDRRVSPLYADLAGLGPTTLFSGTDDILNPDARRFAGRARQAGVEVDLYEVLGAIHVYPLLPMRPGAQARAQIRQLLSVSALRGPDHARRARGRIE